MFCEHRTRILYSVYTVPYHPERMGGRFLLASQANAEPSVSVIRRYPKVLSYTNENRRL